MKIKTLLLSSFLNFVAMFFLTYSAIATWGHFYLSINKVYMAAIMTMPMILINIALMHSMYQDKRKMLLAFAGGLLGLVLVFSFIRNQTFIDDERFLKSMIPHHSRAILVCEQADISDPEIAELCTAIVETQEEEIAIMQRMLEEKY